MTFIPFELADCEELPVPPLYCTAEIRLAHASLRALTPGDMQPGAEAVLEHYEGLATARIYDRAHDEPMVSVYFNAQGQAVSIIVRRFPDVTLEVEDAGPAR